MRQTYWDEMFKTDCEEIKKIAAPGWLAATMPGGGCMMVQVSQIVRVIGEEGPEGRAKLLLANEDLVFTGMTVVELSEKIKSSQNSDSPSAIYRTVEAISRIITVASAIRNWFFRLIALRVAQPLYTRCLALFQKKKGRREIESRHHNHSPFEGESVKTSGLCEG